MSIKEMLEIAIRNKIKAERAYENNINRPGITEQEIVNLKRNIEYTTSVLKMIVEMED